MLNFDPKFRPRQCSFNVICFPTKKEEQPYRDPLICEPGCVEDARNKLELAQIASTSSPASQEYVHHMREKLEKYIEVMKVIAKYEEEHKVNINVFRFYKFYFAIEFNFSLDLGSSSKDQITGKLEKLMDVFAELREKIGGPGWGPASSRCFTYGRDVENPVMPKIR